MEVIKKPIQENKPYRLKCRFKIEPYPKVERLDREKVRLAELFVRDMHAQGWENDPRFGFKMTGPFPQIIPTTIRVPRRLTAREMLPRVLAGERFLDLGENTARLVPRLDATEWWEFEISGVFVRPEIRVERPEPHEEERG